MVASNSSVVFKVRKSEPELVRPAQPTPIEVKSLSHADDKIMMRYHVSCILFYPSNTAMKDKDPAKMIKTALAEALVYYYPWAGRLKDGPDGSLVVDCTAEGVGFVEADADVRLDEFKEDTLQPPFPCIEELVYNKASNFTKTIDYPIFSMQVTRLLCGGFILTFSFNHVMSDTMGACQFVSAIADLARGAMTPSVVPVWQRELLNARDPPRVTCETVLKKFGDHFQVPTEENAPPPPVKEDDNTMTYRSFFFSRRELDALRSRIPEQLRDSYSSFDLITASVLRSRTIALQFPPEQEVRLVFPVDVRRKFVNPTLPAGFYGNACVMATFVCPAGEIYNVGSFSFLVEQVKKAKEEVTEEYARSMIDLSVMGGRPRIPTGLALTYLISDLSRVGLSSLDFGWGKPVYAGTIGNGLRPHIFSFLVAFRNEKGEDGRLIAMCLPVDAMHRFSMELRTLIN